MALKINPQKYNWPKKTCKLLKNKFPGSNWSAILMRIKLSEFFDDKKCSHYILRRITQTLTTPRANALERTPSVSWNKKKKQKQKQIGQTRYKWIQDLINTVLYHFNWCSTLNRTRKTLVKGNKCKSRYFNSRVWADALMLNFKRSVVALMS